jgi:hypothetical protein
MSRGFLFLFYLFYFFIFFWIQCRRGYNMRVRWEMV